MREFIGNIVICMNIFQITLFISDHHSTIYQISCTIFYRYHMYQAFGAGNTAAFSSSISSGYLPPTDHLTYEGLFNEIDFSVGPKTKDVIDIAYGFARVMNPVSLVDQGVNDYLALFLKGNTDGEPRDDRVLNSVIALDISGSMGGCLQRT